MKKYIISAILAIPLLAACTDEWDDHYDAENTTVNEGTLWEAMCSNSDLSNFVDLVEGVGYDITLDGSQVLTVFIPINDYLSSSYVEELIDEYNEQANNGIDDDDNTVIKQVVQNHISLYNYSMDNTGDSVKMTMMNGKYSYLTDGTVNGVSPLIKNQLYTNGILFTLDGILDYYPNVSEYFSLDDDLDSIAAFFDSYNVYEFDADQSVEGDIVDGKTQYLDSVMNLTNVMYDELGYINREDSNYWMLVPTDDQWKELYDEYIEYFNYDNTMNKRDSMINIMTHKAMLRGAIFNMNTQESLNDSAVSTAYSDGSWPYYRFLEPYSAGGVFANITEDIDCSNGAVLKTSTWPIDKTETFFQEIKVEAENSYYQDSIAKAKTPITTCTVESTNPFYGQVSENSYVEVDQLNTASAPVIRYTIPDVLSNIGYDIYAVFVPALAYDTLATDRERLPIRLQIRYYYNTQDGTRLDYVEGVAPRFVNPETNTYYYTTTADVVDTMLIASDFEIPTCSYQTSTPEVMIQFEVQRASSTSTTYSNTLRLDCIVFKPHEDE